jgi:hypothetical protein
MDHDEWIGFKLMVFGAVQKYGNVVQMGDVTGYWLGQEEESFTLTLDVWTWYEGDFNGLRAKLAHAAKLFDQESIALTVAEPMFIKAATE